MGAIVQGHINRGTLLHSNTQATQVQQREELEVGIGRVMMLLLSLRRDFLMKMSFNYRVCQRERETFYLHIYTQSPTTVTPVQLVHMQEGFMAFRHVTHFSYSKILN